MRNYDPAPLPWLPRLSVEQLADQAALSEREAREAYLAGDYEFTEGAREVAEACRGELDRRDRRARGRVAA